MSTTTTAVDVLIIGAGQAGLAMGYQLRERGLNYLLIERNARIGDSWRARFDSLVLFTPRAYSALPGLPVSGDPDGYPTKDEIADYLETYAAHFRLPIRLGTGIEHLGRSGNGYTAITTSGDIITARAVVIATGAFQEPAVPTIATRFDPEVTQLTPATYRNPQTTPAGTVLVVGDGATGRQIARELAATHHVVLATGRPKRVSPDRILGKPLFWWLDKTGLIRKSRETRLGRKLMAADSFPGKHLDLPRLREAGVTVAGRLTEAVGRQVRFDDGTEATTINTVVWATGYRDRTDWVAIPEVIDETGTFIQQRGISPAPGLTFIGRSWQWSRGSAILTGVGDDAAYVALSIVETLASSEGAVMHVAPRVPVRPDAGLRLRADAVDA
jgi:putative flavoprotein involved in K+ transport